MAGAEILKDQLQLACLVRGKPPSQYRASLLRNFALKYGISVSSSRFLVIESHNRRVRGLHNVDGISGCRENVRQESYKMLVLHYCKVEDYS